MADNKSSIFITAVDQTQAAFASVNRSLGGLSSAGSTLNGVLARMAPLLGAATFTALIKNSLDAADSMGKAAQKVGTTTEALSGLKYAADLADVPFETLQKGMEKLAKTADAAAGGSKEAAEAFKRIKIDPAQYKDSADLFAAVAEKLSKLPDGAQKTALAMQLLGKSGAEMIPLLNLGADGIKKMTDEAEKSGMIITGEAARASEEFNDNLERLGKMGKGMSQVLVNDMAPALVDISTAMLQAAKDSSVFMAAWVAMGGVMAHILGMDEASKAKDRLDEVNKTIATMQKQLASGSMNPEGAGDSFFNFLIPDVKLNDKAKAALQANLNSMMAERDRILQSLKPPPALPKPTASAPPEPDAPKAPRKTPERAITPSSEAAKNYAEEWGKLNDILAGTKQLSEAEQVLREVESGKFNDLLPWQREQLANLAQSVVEMQNAANMADLLADSDQRQLETADALAEADRQAADERDKTFADLSERLTTENEDLNAALIKGDKARAKAQLDLEHQRSLDRINGLMLESEQAQALVDAETENYKLRLGQINDSAKETGSFMKDLGATFSSAFEDAITSGKSFSDVLQGLGQDIERMLTRKFITDPFMKGIDSLVSSDAVGNWFSDLFSSNAAGGVYSGAGIGAYSGQVVSSPTLFPFAKGIGLMGEAGAEAIMPLSRGADGKLGVQSSGGAGGVTVNLIESPGNGGKVEKRDDGGGNLSVDIFVEQIESKINRNIQRGTGLAPVLEGTYGLNRAAGALR